jgi:hypothetical protein
MPSPAKPSNPAAKPAQVPGDAESPPRSEADRTAENAVKHTDRTEPAQSRQDSPAGKPA